MAGSWGMAGFPHPLGEGHGGEGREQSLSAAGLGSGLRTLAPHVVRTLPGGKPPADVGTGRAGDARGMRGTGDRPGDRVGRQERLGTGRHSRRTDAAAHLQTAVADAGAHLRAGAPAGAGKTTGRIAGEVFTASDSLGWVYQFWQAKRKDEVNASEVKIGADELPAVTQLFTEPYMVEFLLHNSLGAWWVTRQSDQPCPVPLPYLRRLEDGTPAAGSFAGWTDSLRSFQLLDPCCGSGHFLVAAFLLLTPMRMATEGLSAREAVDAVLRDNLHGLELDPRCVEILRLRWRWRPGLIPMRAVIARCPRSMSLLRVEGERQSGRLGGAGAQRRASRRVAPAGVQLLHAAMRDAPLLGSLLDPWRRLKNDLAMSEFGGFGNRWARR